MEDMMAKIQSILSDPESMAQIGQLAKMFSAENPGEPSTEQSAAQESKAAPDLSQLMSAFSGIGGQGGQQAGGVDLNTIAALQKVMSAANQPDKNRDFLLALRPLLKEESRRKIDKLAAIFRIMSVLPALKESGLLGGDLLGIL